MKSTVILAVATFGVKLASANFQANGDHRLQITTRSFGNVTTAPDDDANEVSKLVVEDDSEEGWFPIESHGLMLERSYSAEEIAHLKKRAGADRIPRDFERGLAEVEIDTHGNLNVARSLGDVKTMAKKAKRGIANFATIITWYTGHDLLNPSCIPWNHKKWNPTDRSFVAAITEAGWKNAPSCGDFYTIRSGNKKSSVTVRVIDTCAGCAEGSKHMDLTKAAFTKLYGLGVGEVGGLQAKKVGAPVKKWNSKAVALYGPQHL